jgi:hypothetical protein
MALVIGNGAYAEAPLRNPVNDAQALKRVLESSKFQVTLLTNASKREMENATGPSEAELEATYWEGIQNSQEAKDIKTFLGRFPDGAHAELASLKMKRLMAPAPRKAATLPSPPPITPVPENHPQQTQTKAVQTQNETVYVTKTGKKFHRAGCPSLRYSAIAMKRWEAIAKGYAPCKICNP